MQKTSPQTPQLPVTRQSSDWFADMRVAVEHGGLAADVKEQAHAEGRKWGDELIQAQQAPRNLLERINAAARSQNSEYVDAAFGECCRRVLSSQFQSNVRANAALESLQIILEKNRAIETGPDLARAFVQAVSSVCGEQSLAGSSNAFAIGKVVIRQAEYFEASGKGGLRELQLCEQAINAVLKAAPGVARDTEFNRQILDRLECLSYSYSRLGGLDRAGIQGFRK